MNCNPISVGFAEARGRRKAGFSLIELLTVIFIISLLIAILLPSLNNARAQAKCVAGRALLNAIDTGLELFRNDNESEFGRTNGYPPSFAHPRIVDEDGNVVFSDEDAAEGRFPFLKESGGYPCVYGTHFLSAMLLGADLNGFIQRRSVPKDQLKEPWKWYEPDPDTGELLPRQSLYLDSGELRLVATEDLIGSPNLDDFFPDYNDMKQLPVIVDPFDQPVLYYVATRGGSMQNMVENEHDPQNRYPDGKPIYFHQDNVGFTGWADSAGEVDPKEGWDFGGGGDHRIAFHGADLTALDIDDARNKDSFARYILDVNAFRAIREEIRSDKSPLRPVRRDSYLLITPGPDGLYGTNDDVSNIPRQE